MTARRPHGQHFLEPAWVAKLIDQIDPQPDDRFLEIGPGRGALTLPLAARGGTITAVEIDPRLSEGLRTRLPGNATVITQDFLKLPDRLPPELQPPARAVGNLPYNVAAPILIKLLPMSGDGRRLEDATLMLQREVADRVTAGPGTADWGPLAVVTSLHAERARVMTLPPGAFRPMPRVHSAVVQLRFRPSPVPIADRALFDTVVRTLFMQRRKMAVNALAALVTQLTTLTPDAVFARAHVDPRLRPSQIKLAELAELVEVLATYPR